MSINIERRPEVDEDLFEIATYIAMDNPGAAMAFLDAVEETFDDLGRTPGLGRHRRFSSPRLAGIRSWRVKGFPNYIIFYRESPRALEIIRILHGARDIEMILKK